MKGVTDDYHPSNRRHFFLSTSVHNNLHLNNAEKIKFASSVFLLQKETPAWWGNPLEDGVIMQPPKLAMWKCPQMFSWKLLTKLSSSLHSWRL